MTVSLLLLVVGFVIGAQAGSVSFIVDVLRIDLDVILKYHKKTGNYNPAYIYWPNSITLQVLREDEQLLKIDGNFMYERIFSSTFSGLYYGNEEFYLKSKTGVLMPITHERKVSYKQPDSIKEVVPYLAIKYFSIEEMERSIKPYYLANQVHFFAVLEEKPGIFLFTPPDSDQYFMEYSFKGTSAKKYSETGFLQVLIEFNPNKQVSVEINKQAYRLVFDQRTQTLTIPSTSDVNSDIYANVFGVRMAATGFMTEVRGSTFRRINYNDLDVDSGIPESHATTNEDFLEKLCLVEPRFTNSKTILPEHRLLNEGRFQVQGCVWKKKINYFANGSINEECPLVVELEDLESNFKIDGQDVTRLCTNHTNLWVFK